LVAAVALAGVVLGDGNACLVTTVVVRSVGS
jgi:hypothetical protein